MSKIQKALRALSESKKHQRNFGNANAITEASAGEKTATVQSNQRSASFAANSGNEKLHKIEERNKIEAKHSIEVTVGDLEKAGLLPNEEDLSVIGQQFRRIKRPIIKFAFDMPIGENTNVVMMASALPGAGKTFCAFNLAQSVALEQDVGSVLVDADVLKPGISRSFGLQDHVGLIDYLIDSSVELNDILVQTNLNGIMVIPAGRQHPEATELLASRRMQELVSLLSNQYMSRAVIFDMPPLLLTSEAQVLAAQAGQIVMVIEARVTSRESMVRAISMLDQRKPINAILNKSRNAASGDYQGDNYGYYSNPSQGDEIEQIA